MDWKQELGEKIERARRERGWTQDQLGAQANFHPNTIGFYERGERAPDFDQLRRIAAALGRDYFYVGDSIRIDFGQNGKPHPEPKPQQLEFRFDEKKGVNVRIEPTGDDIVIRKFSA
jgi:transcriptional regulator with XRE-family HTH domain